MPSFANLLVFVSAAATVMASQLHQARAHHGHDLAKRVEENLQKRFAAHRVTWYPTNTGADACTGRNHGDYDNIVALNIPQWGNLNARSQYCGKKIRIHANGKSEIGVIQDACATCYNHGEIDLTKGLFQKFATLDQGVFDATWEFVDGDDGDDGGDDGGDDDDDKPKPKPPPKPPVKKPAPKPTPPAKLVKPTEKKSSSKSKSHSSSAKHSSSSSVSKSTVIPTPPAPTPTPSVPDASDSGVGNAGSNPNADSDSSLSGGIASDGLNGAASITFNKFVAGAAALLLAAQAL